MKKLFFLLYLFLSLGVISIGGVGVNLYVLKKNHPLLERVQRLLPYPLAYVGGEIITYKEYKSHYEDILFQRQRVEELGIEGVPSIDETALKQQILETLIRRALAERMAKQEGIMISGEATNQYFEEQILPQAGGDRSQVEQTLRDLFGWNTDDFKEKVVQEYLLEKALSEKNGKDINILLDEAQKSSTILKFIP